MTKNKRSILGLTLLESAVAILIAGLIAAPIIMAYDSWMVEQRKEVTFTNVVKVVERLQTFRQVNGFYPLPANLNDPTSSGDYGNSIPAPCDASSPVGTVVLREAIPSRAAVLNPTSDPNSTADDVCMGFVPFRELQIDEREAYDGYNNRLFYAITVSSTDVSTIDDAAGAISVVDEDDNSLSPIDGDVTYVVFSAGANQAGAYTRNGSSSGTPCGNAGFEVINCDQTLDEAQYRAVFNNTSYDDVLQYFSDTTIPLWQRDLTNVDDIYDISPDGVAVGRDQADFELDIAAPTVGARDALLVRGPYDPNAPKPNADGLQGMVIMSENGQICNSDVDLGDPMDVLTKCMSLSEFASSSYECGADEIAVGITEGVLRCGPAEQFKVECPDEEPVFLGLDVNNEPDCIAIPLDSCESGQVFRDINYCDVEVTIEESGYDGDITEGWYSLTDCSEMNFICAGGEWQPNITNGYCLNFPDDPPDPICVDPDGNPLTCAGRPDGNGGSIDNDPGDVDNPDDTWCYTPSYVCLANPPDDGDIDDVVGFDWSQDTYDENCHCNPDQDFEHETKSCEWYYVVVNGDPRSGPAGDPSGTPRNRQGTVKRRQNASGGGSPGSCQASDTGDCSGLPGDCVVRGAWAYYDFDCTCNVQDDETGFYECPVGQIGEGTEWSAQFQTTSADDLPNCYFSEQDPDELDPDDCTCEAGLIVNITTGDNPTCDATCERTGEPAVFADIQTGDKDANNNCVVEANQWMNRDSDWNHDGVDYPQSTCLPRTYQWVSHQVTDVEAPNPLPSGAKIIGESCACPNMVDGELYTCYPGSNATFAERCKCED